MSNWVIEEMGKWVIEENVKSGTVVKCGGKP